MKNLLLIITLIFIQNSFSQNTCASKEESLEDFNVITKCKITPVESKRSKGTKTLNVKISTNRKHYLKKRKRSDESVKLAEIKEKNRTMNLTSISNMLSSKEVNAAKRFIEADKIPSFKKCNNSNGKVRLECFNAEMIAHINKNFHYPANAVQNKIEAKIWVRFIIDQNGFIRNVKTISTNASVDTSELEEVAMYVVNKLPVFQPGTKEGVVAAFKYGFPIEFSLDD